jgi:anti-sigma B factor antagonist
MELTRTEVRGVAVVGIHGKLLGGPDDLDKFHTFFKSILERGNKNIVIDLRNTPYANSVGIGMLIGVYASARRLGGEMVLAHVVDRIMRILAVTKLLLIFKTFEDVDGAVGYLLDKTNGDQGVDAGGNHILSEAPPQPKNQQRFG